MSLESWQKEFYIIPANSPKLKTKAQRIEHSLQKWLGLTPENLKKNEVEADSEGNLADGSLMFYINDETCALCRHYYEKTPQSGCEECPLNNHLGGDCSNWTNPGVYDMWNRLQQPSRMITALAKTLDTELKKESKK